MIKKYIMNILKAMKVSQTQARDDIKDNCKNMGRSEGA